MVAAFIRTWASSYLRADVVYAAEVKTQSLVADGPYRYVRNPMYVSFAVVLVGMSLYLARPALLIYTAVLLVLLAAFVRWYEERTLVRRFGDQYSAYRSQVGAWLPRVPHRRP
jgi:protein-S-isoprenylcysteine O-methyltransferase Ste14